MAIQESSLGYMTTIRIGKKGQLTVPKQFREDIGLGSGQPVVILRLGDGVILLPAQRRFEYLCSKVSKVLTCAGVTRKKLLASLPEARQRVFDIRYEKHAVKARR